MRNSAALWETWNLSQKFKRLPSEILRIDDELAAYCLDRAILLFASHVQKAIDAATKDKKENQIEAAAWNALAPWIGAEQKFAAPTMGSR